MERLGLRRLATTDRLVAWGVTAIVTFFVLRQLWPSFVFRDTTPATGDLAGHMNAIAHLRDDLLGHGRLAGWSQDWFTGFPAFTFYLPMAGLLVATVGLVLPLNVALKLVAVLAPLALPVVAYAFGRMNRCDRLTSSCLAVAMLPLLLQPSLFFRGGSIAATVGGEFNYGLALTIGLLAVGLARAGLRTGRHRALTAGLLAVTLLLHVVPAAVTVVGVVVATVLRPLRARVRWSGSVLAVAGALSAFWVVPFVLLGRFTAGSEESAAPSLLKLLLPVEIVPVVLLAVVGVVVTSVSDDGEEGDLRYFLLAMVAATGLACIITPTTRLGTGRFAGMWFLWLCLLAGYGTAGLARAADGFRRKLARGRPLDAPTRARLLLPVVVVGVFLSLYDSRDWTGLLTTTTEPWLRRTAATSFRGYEQSLDRVEFNDFLGTMRSVGADHGCGRAHMEVTQGAWSDLSAQPLSWITPLVTDDCITVTGGLYVQSSPTSPFVEAVNRRLSSAAPRRPNSPPFDLAAGIDGLRTLGVRYFVATSPTTVQEADASGDLRSVAQTGLYGGQRFWKVYEIPGVEVVEPVRHLPVVVPGSGRSRTSWEDLQERWYDSGEGREVPVAADGPEAWPRAERFSERPPRRPVGGTTEVSRTRIEHDRISFRVSRPGVPVLVKVSWFPNWRASGAEGPYRVTPNQMVVVPTSKEVTLRYGRSPLEYAGWAGTLAGIGGLVLLARRGPVDMPEPRPEPAPRRPGPRPRQGPAAGPKRKKRRK